MAWILCVLSLSACTYGAPLGFSSGDSWSAPLVGPLEDRELVVPVRINGQGPYLFVIDSDAPVSSVDAAIQSELELYASRGEELADERDRKVQTTDAEVKKLQVGDQLTVSNLKVKVHNVGTYSVSGRLMRGVLGRDVIADSLILGVDRDRGLITLATQGHLAAPAGAARLGWRDQRFALGPRRRLTSATVNGKQVTMHIDLGAELSQLWARKMQQLELPRVGVRATTVDELATSRQVSFGAMAATVSAGGVDTHGLLMLPYEDKRTRDIDLDGSLGLNFFVRHNLVVNLHTKAVYMSPREADPGELTSERLGRWGAAFARCQRPACVTVKIEGTPVETPPAAAPPAAAEPDPLADPLAAPQATPPSAAPGAPAQGGPYTLFVRREPAAPTQPYDVLIEAVDAAGKPAGLPRLLVTLPRDQAEVVGLDFDPAYAAAAGFRVLDASPFPRDCRENRCVFPQPPRL